jgi:hypothetical protein
MADGNESAAELCTEVEMTPAQCNAVVEDKLGHLKPVLECALVTFQRVEEVLANGGIDWRKLFAKAKERVSD